MTTNERERRLLELRLRGARAVAYQLLDGEGRPFGEGNAPEARRAGVPFETRTCPYHGSRLGKPMNVSALRQITANWDDLLKTVGWLRREYTSRRGEPESIYRLWQFGTYVTSIPAYLHALRPDGDPLPAAVAALFKTTQGIFMTAAAAFHSGSFASDHRISAGDFLDATENLGVFVLDGHACAGPPHMIEEFVRVVVGETVPEPPTADAAAVFGDMNTLFAYAPPVTAMEMVWTCYDESVALIVHELLRVLGGDEGSNALAERLRSTAKRAAAHDISASEAIIALQGGLVAGEIGEPYAPTVRTQAIDVVTEVVAGPEPARRALSTALVHLSFVERETLRVLQRCQDLVDEALGRPDRVALDQRDLPKALRAFLQDAAGIELVTSPTEAFVRRDERRIDVL